MVCDAYPLMFSNGTDMPKEDLPDMYQDNIYWQYFQKEESWYSDSNNFENPFEQEDDHGFGDVEFYPLKRTNSYEILGVDRSCSKEEIKRKFRERALETHPDKGGDPEDFRKVREAYEMLIS